jgi:L-malate glycosyltransferase
MNVMEIVSGAGINGAIVHCLLLTRELARRGHAVTLVCRPGAWIGTQLQGEPIEVIESDLHRWPPDELRRITAALRARRIEVVHTHMSRAHFFGVLLRWWSGVPCVATAHSRYFQLHWMFNDRVIAVSEATRRFHRLYNFVRPNRIEVIPNFVDHQRFANVGPEVRPAIRAALGIDDAVPLIGTVGQVTPEKGISHLVRAMAKVAEVIPEAQLLVVGDGPDTYLKQIKSAARQLGVASSIRWIGHRTDVPEVVAALDVFVLASLEENFSLATTEAMAAGLPVVATTVGGLSECVINGETGILVPPADSDALAAAIIALLRDPELRRRFGYAGRTRVQRLFCPDVLVPRIEASLASTAARSVHLGRRRCG